jgi:bifunctional non-homologous end joining protein LigD
MALEHYREKRDFTRTREPRGKKLERNAFSYVIQKHAARQLHYDFRLELDGVLLSWAVPKGPSLDPGVKRLAMQVEDHPVEYGGFEGTIPKGEYGGGTVMIWDRGSWEPEGDPREAYRKGRLTFTLKGQKLRGRWHLVRTRGRDSRGSKQAWLLFKSSDEHAKSDNGAIVDEQPSSALSGRSLDQIAKSADRVWSSRSGEVEAPARASTRKPPRSASGVTQVRLTNPDRILYPELRLTKRDLADYYAKVASFILPHVENRPLTLVRCPEGWTKQCFFQKHAKDGAPPAIRPVPIRDEEATVQYMAVDDVMGLISLVQIGALELHTWGSHADDPERPDLMVFDLDPDPALSFSKLADAARSVRARLEELGLKSFVKTTGGKGLHVCAPFARKQLGWETLKAFTKRIAEEMVREEPDRYVATVSKSQRKGKIFIDYLRNGRGATFVAPYSTRAREGAPVAVPLEWDELGGRKLPRYDVLTLPARLLELERDPWAEVARLRQSVTASALKRVGVR